MDLERLYEPANVWQCKICGEYVGTEEDDMEEHMEEHTQKQIKECLRKK